MIFYFSCEYNFHREIFFYINIYIMTQRKTKQRVRKTKRSVRKTRRQSAGAASIVKVSPSPGTMSNILTGVTIAIAAAKAWDEWTGDSAKIKRIKIQDNKMTNLIDYLVNHMAETLQYGIEELSRRDSKYNRFMRSPDADVPQIRRQYKDVLLNLPNSIKREYKRFVTESISQLFILFNDSPNKVKFMRKWNFTNGFSKNSIDNYSFNPRGLSKIRMFELLQHSSLINKSYEEFMRADRRTKPTLPSKHSDFYNFIYRYIYKVLDSPRASDESRPRQRQRQRQRQQASRSGRQDTRLSRQEENVLRALAERSQTGRQRRLSRQEENALRELAERSQTGRYADWSGTDDDYEDEDEDDYEDPNYAREWIG